MTDYGEPWAGQEVVVHPNGPGTVSRTGVVEHREAGVFVSVAGRLELWDSSRMHGAR